MATAGRPAKRVKSSASQDDAQKPDWISADDGMTTDASRMSWKRPPMPTLDPSSDSIAFQWFDAQDYEGRPLKRNPHRGSPHVGSTQQQVPVIRLWGITGEGNSVCCNVHGFTPYFYCSAPVGFNMKKGLAEFRTSLNRMVLAGNTHGFRCADAVLGVNAVSKKSIFGYAVPGSPPMRCLQVHVASQRFIASARGILERGFVTPGCGPSPRSYQCFEAKLPFVLRCLIDCDIVGANWLELPAATYSVRPADGSDSELGLSTETHSQCELDVVFNSIVSHKPDGEWMKLAPIRVLSYDIECKGRKGHFPEASQDPVIQIASILTEHGRDTPIDRNVHVLDTCLPIIGARVVAHRDERELLKAWTTYVVESDPDIITGYNSNNFDMPYILDRAAALGVVSNVDLLGRLVNVHSKKTESTFSSAAFGKRKHWKTEIPGRIQLDMIDYMRRNHKLSSYSLNAVSYHFLKQQKEDVHHSIISELQMGSAEDRRRLAVYCLKDAFLPLRLMDNQFVLFNYVEMARVTGVPLDFLLTRGQQIKVVSMLYRKARSLDLVVPTLQRRGDSASNNYEGATVIEPKRAFYDTPIATLDFASLYPSIMMAHNLCYSTLVSRENVAKLDPSTYQKTPTGDVFVKSTTQKGILPTILAELLGARKQAKKDMKAAKDPMVKAVQNGRQLALKISANSVYGFTGATVGQLPCLAISSSTTAYGRTMIEDTKNAVESMYTIANGYPADAEVVYGDTDSVMVKFGVDTVAESMRLGKEAAERITRELFPPPVRLEFEKVYFPYLLMNKKRYAGMYWTNPDHYDKMDTKGIETVRRDNCLLVRQVVGTVLHKILVERSVPSAIDFVKGIISDLLQGKLDISLLVITKAVSKMVGDADYKSKQAHVELAERMRKRDPGTAPALGDRVPYVIIQKGKNARAFEKSEDPVYVLEHNIPVDTKYYLENQLSKPLTRIFGPVLDNVSVLFSGEHTRKITKQAPKAKAGGMMMFAVKRVTCIAPKCRQPVEKNAALCPRCVREGKQASCYVTELDQVGQLEGRYSELWSHCQRCQGSLHHDVICGNRDCPIFYMRKKAAKDLDKAVARLERFALAPEHVRW